MDCIEGVFPRCEQRSKEEPEELRCMYVALTRAKERLVLMRPEYRESWQDKERQLIPAKVSRFLMPQNVRPTLDVFTVHS